MFGLFRSRGERLALKLERLLLTQESAYEKGAWDVFVYAGQQTLPTLRKLIETGWSESQLEEFLARRGLVRSIDPQYRARMEDAQREARALY